MTERGLLSSIVSFSVRFRGVVLALAVVALVWGALSLTGARYDVFPEFASKEIEIQTEAPGLAPEQVELLVTRPVENAVNGSPGLESLRSESVEGLSHVIAVFAEDTDVFRARQLVAERLATLAGTLPEGSGAPTMTPLTSSTGDLMTIGLTSTTRSLMDVRTIADWTVQQRLLAVPGVAKVSVYGGEVRQIQLQVDPRRLVSLGIGLDEVLAAAKRATGVRGAGFVDTGTQRIVLRTDAGVVTAADVAAIVVRHETEGNVTLGDVGTVVDAPEPAISGGSIQGRPGVVLNLWTQYGANTVEVTRGVDAALAELRPVLTSNGIELWPDLFRAAKFIDIATANVRASLLIGALLVIVVLFLFLADLRSAAISCTAIPLSLLTAVAVLQKLGFTLNTMTLGGLAIAIGEVVDDAVIDVENILRRLREAAEKGTLTAADRLRIVLEASIEVRGAVVYATFAVALVFVPVVTLSGLAGRLFAPMALAYVLAILASLVVALTVTPALSLALLRSETSEKGLALQTRLKEGYRTVLVAVERHRGVVAGTAVFVTTAGLLLALLLPQSFLPELHEGHYLVHLETAPGTSIDESLRIGAQASRALLEVPFVRTVAQRAGRAATDDVYGPHSSELELDLKEMSGKDAASAAGRLRDALSKVPGGAFAVNTFLTERIEETIAGYTAPVVVEIFGDDLDALDAAARDTAAVLGHIRGAADVQLQSPPGAPQLSIHLRRDAIARWGLAPLDVLDAVRTAYEGTTVGEVYSEGRPVEASVILNPNARRQPTDVAALPIRTANGTFVRLSELADVVPSAGRYAIVHDAARRVNTVTCAVQGRDVGSFVAEAQRAVAASVRLPHGAFLRFTGAAEAQSQSRRELAAHSLFAAVGILILLAVVFRRPRNLLLVVANLPFALIGGVIALLLTGTDLSIGSLVGFVTLFGITVRNSIMLVSHYEHLVRVEGCAWDAETVLRGATERLIPILMTSIVTALGLLPLALGSGSPGREIEGPMAIVILGGLVTSTALNLLVLPTLARRFARFDA